jgi:hypothetical protein
MLYEYRAISESVHESGLLHIFLEEILDFYGVLGDEILNAVVFDAVVED